MANREVLCPTCGILLTVPQGADGCIARCKVCQSRFRLPAEVASEEAVAAWLDEEEHPEDSPDLHGSGGGTAPRASRADSPASQLTQSTGGQESFTSGSGAICSSAVACASPMRLVRFDPAGVLVEFPSAALLEEDFRLSVPRRCLRCGGTGHLKAHVIVFSPTLRDSFSMEAEHAAGELTLAAEQVGDLRGQSLLDALPRVPNVPPPADLPMPFWVCDLCSPSGLLSAQFVQAHSEGLCRLMIRNLRAGAELLTAAGAGFDPGVLQLRSHIDNLAEHPWQQLPSEVKHRMEQWFKADAAERFLAYVADRDFAHTEDGMSGLVITTQRLVYHTQNRHRAAPRGEELALTLSGSDGMHLLQIHTPHWHVGRLRLDPQGLAVLRRALTLGDFRPTWQ